MGRRDLVSFLLELDDARLLDDPADQQLYDYLHHNYPEWWTDDEKAAFDAEMEARLREGAEDDDDGG